MASKWIWKQENFCASTKNNFAECKSSFCLTQNVCDCHNMYVNKFLDWHKKFGPAQNIFGPVKGQGIRQKSLKKFRWYFGPNDDTKRTFRN